MLSGLERVNGVGLRLVVVCAGWGVFWGAWSGLLPAIKDQLGASTADLGLALVAISVGAIPAMPVAGRLARGRESLVLAVSMAGLAATAVVLGFISEPWLFAAMLLVLGVASGSVDVALNMATARGERVTGSRLFQPVHAAFPVAVIVAAPAAGFARDLGLSTAAVLGCAAALVLAAGAAVVRLPLGDTVPDPDKKARPGRWGIGVVLGLLGACLLIVENAVEQWSAILLEDYLSAGPVLAAAAPATYMAALTIGRLIAQALPALTMRTLFLIAGLGGSAGIVVAGLATTPWVSLAGFGLSGLTFAPLMPAILSDAGTRDTTGAVVTTVSVVSYAGFVISPLAVAALTLRLPLSTALACLGVLGLPLLIPALRRSRAG
ncbi:MFS transporter [Acrocarpospora corrugata]|uniref:MFS transporter n=1 Tax=Acrocarpospora corrugata TaxID=35763 RepID=A0A5M3W1J2_9ACTN|nr:MFS transporter [Acrocarpospora corrugata]GES00991.1 MFS transporter [Acrocarpospora corrugata]